MLIMITTRITRTIQMQMRSKTTIMIIISSTIIIMEIRIIRIMIITIIKERIIINITMITITTITIILTIRKKKRWKQPISSDSKTQQRIIKHHSKQIIMTSSTLILEEEINRIKRIIKAIIIHLIIRHLFRISLTLMIFRHVINRNMMR